MSKFTNALKRTSIGVLDGAALLLDASILSRMTEIEKQIDTLQAEYATLNEKVNANRRRPVPYQK